MTETLPTELPVPDDFEPSHDPGANTDHGDPWQPPHHENHPPLEEPAYPVDENGVLDDHQGIPRVTRMEKTLAWAVPFLASIESVDDSDGIYWCPQWFEHPEAFARIDALRTAHEKAVKDDELSSFWLHHWDSHARILLSKDGPFSTCRYNKHKYLNSSATYQVRLGTK